MFKANGATVTANVLEVHLTNMKIFEDLLHKLTNFVNWQFIPNSKQGIMQMFPGDIFHFLKLRQYIHAMIFSARDKQHVRPP